MPLPEIEDAEDLAELARRKDYPTCAAMLVLPVILFAAFLLFCAAVAFSSVLP